MMAQEPRPPFPYLAKDIEFASGDGVELAGTLTLPGGAGPFAGVVLISGGGAQDRDEFIAGHKPFHVLADALTRAGHAVLRFDRRGVACSGGRFATSTYAELVGDVLAALAVLRAHPHVDPRRTGLLGHSEGGYLAPLVARRLGADDAPAAFVILLAAPAVPGEEVLVWQHRLLLELAGAAAEELAAQERYVRELVALLRAEDYPAAEALTRASGAAALPEVPDATPAQIVARARALAKPWVRSFAVHDPGPALEALTVPVLACYGDRDLQVPPARNEPALRARLAGHPDATIRVFPGLNHLLQPAPTGSPAEYPTIATTLAREVLEAVTGWLRARSANAS